MDNVKEELKKYMFDMQFYEEVVSEIKELQTKLLVATNRANTYGDINNTIEIEDIRKQIKAKERALAKIEKSKTAVEETINAIDQPYKNVLYFRYVKQYKFNKIAMKMGYSLQRIFQLNKEAIEKYAKVRDGLDKQKTAKSLESNR